MKIIPSISTWQTIRKHTDFAHESIGFVPTMGNLHDGHKSLIEQSTTENAITVMSIFVNPTQFDKLDDLEKYPRTFKQDCLLAEKSGADFILVPEFSELYSDNYRYQINETDFSHQLCGAHRPGHFTGVMTVVLKLLQVVKPNRAYFGEKDYQQLHLIKGMVDAFFIDTHIIACPIIRDKNGLALSSRNNRLTPHQYQLVIHFPKLLCMNIEINEIIQRLTELGFIVDYIEEYQDRRLGAVTIGDIRLIDNVLINIKD